MRSGWVYLFQLSHKSILYSDVGISLLTGRGGIPAFVQQSGDPPLISGWSGLTSPRSSSNFNTPLCP